MRRCRLAGARFEELRERLDVQDVARKCEHPRRLGRELSESENGLLGGDKNTGIVDDHVSLECI